MFIRVSRGSSDPAIYDDIVALTDDFVAAFKRLPGFVSYQTGIDPSTGKALTPGIYRLVIDAVSTDDVTSERLLGFTVG